MKNMVPNKSSLTENTLRNTDKTSIQNFYKLCTTYVEKNIVHNNKTNKTIKTTLTQYKKYANSLVPPIEDFDKLAIGDRTYLVGQSILLNFIINTIPDDFKKCFGVPKPNLLIRSYYTPVVYMSWRHPGCNIYKKYLIGSSNKYKRIVIESCMYLSIKHVENEKLKYAAPLEIHCYEKRIHVPLPTHIVYSAVNITDKIIDDESSCFVMVKQLIEQEKKFDEKYLAKYSLEEWNKICCN